MNELEKLSFNKKERNALIILMVLLSSSYVYMYTYKPKFEQIASSYCLEDVLSTQDVSEESKDHLILQLDSIVKKKEIWKEKGKKKKLNQNYSNRDKYKSSKANYSFEKKEAIYVSFDPNKVDSLTLRGMQIPTYVIKNIMNYRSKGGVFFSCEDLQKIYGLKESDFQRISSYCAIKNPLVKKSKKKRTQKVNLNSADTTALKELQGIGSTLASRIVRYRKNIGGFHSVNQLLEVYGVEQEVINKNLEFLSINTEIKKLNINTIEKEELSKHYYFDYKLSKLIINYRKQHGPYNTVEELKKIIFVTDSIYSKIEPYCTI